MSTLPEHRVATMHQRVGHDFGLSKPVVLDQARIDQFAGCTGDNQWIHVDVARARRDSPLGGTIAHGLLTLALIPAAQFELGVYPSDASNVLNYGFERVRFLAPVPEGSAIAIRVELAEVEGKGSGRYLVRSRNTAYKAGDFDKPVMVADTLAMVMA
ncbi:MAG TPA: MaoC family dehydratase [Burkholderiaceae bacterium]|nr:MaoC family dehydratase [Burkholderiaceae bacterium]